MWLPAQKIQQLFAYPEYRPNDVDVIAVVCASCKHAETYFLHRKSANHNPKDQVVLAESPRYGDIYLAANLRCEVESCKLRVPLFAHWSVDLSADQRLVDTTHWKAVALVCPNGHALHLPDFAPPPTTSEEISN
jgi:hypothetical protein